MSTATKIRIPFADAFAIAAELYEQLAPACLRAKAVGSLRRQRPEVSDIEFLIEPHPGTAGLFDEAAPDLDAIRQVARRWHPYGALAKNGDRYIQVAMPRDGKLLNIDLFLCHPPAQWGSLLAIRTGPAELGKHAVTLMRERGLVHREGHVEWARSGVVLPTPEEEDFFRAAGLPCLPPARRDSREAYRSIETPCLACGAALDVNARAAFDAWPLCSGCRLKEVRP